jgi:hypothetical protein
MSSFPPLFIMTYLMIVDAAKADPEYVAGSGRRERADTWRSWSRWKRVSEDLIIKAHEGLNDSSGYIQRRIDDLSEVHVQDWVCTGVEKRSMRFARSALLPALVRIRSPLVMSRISEYMMFTYKV